MELSTTEYTKQLHREIKQTPEEYRGLLLRIVHYFREGVVLPTAEESFRDGWLDTLKGNTKSIDDLWDGIE
jgi:hypothetical protein